jgi:Spy/CpxP family protein refolding chaperone
MTKTKVILLVSFLLIFAAGTALGIWISGERHPERRSWLVNELNLSSDQEEQMRKIWSEVMDTRGRQHGEQRAALAQKRDQDIAALLSDAQRTQYQAILQEYSRQMDALAQERRKAFEEAVERTKKILTPEQAAKYDELMKRQRESGRGERGGFRGGRDRFNGPKPEVNTEPAAVESTAPHSGE